MAGGYDCDAPMTLRCKVAGSGKSCAVCVTAPYRPDLTILDDIENDEQVRNPEQRDKLNA